MKKYKLLISPSALADIKNAASWYNKQQKGLGKRFRKEVKETITEISLNPFFASVKYTNFRTVACRVFPFSIHYEINEEEKLVRITSVFHFNRNPYWLDEE